MARILRECGTEDFSLWSHKRGSALDGAVRAGFFFEKNRRGKNQVKKVESGGGFSPLARHPPFFGKNLAILGAKLDGFFPFSGWLFWGADGGRTSGVARLRLRFEEEEV